MQYMLLQHQVQHIDEWLENFEASLELRVANGQTSSQIFRKEENPQMVIMILGWESLEKARAFSLTDEFTVMMNQSGAIGRPTVLFLNGQPVAEELV